ncbi:MAG TPA: hypothetical protein VE890_05050, partial [Thermoguttaceae bacterium]|nr:hypothetical protein [Thermoguttaceae bacterium]
MSATTSARNTKRRSVDPSTATQQPKIGIRRSWTRLVQYDARLPQTLIDSLWNNPDRFIDDGQVLVCKPGVRTSVRFSCEQHTFVLKRYQARSWRHAAKDAVLRSWARAGWLVTHRLVGAGVATPRPMAYVENRFGPFRGRS